MTQTERQAIADRVRWLTNHGRHLEAWHFYHESLGAAPDRVPAYQAHRPLMVEAIR